MASNKLSGWNEHGCAILSNDWKIETAFRALAEIEAGIEKSQTPVESDSLVQWVWKTLIITEFQKTDIDNQDHSRMGASCFKAK